MRDASSREVTDSIIPRRWAYIHLPPHDGSVPGKSSRPRVPPLFRLVYRIPSPDLFICICVRKHKRRDLHVLADVDVNRSCENLGFDHLVFGHHARRFDGTYERKIDNRCKGYGIESARWLIERDGWDRAACSSRSRTSLVRILQLVVKDVAD